MVISPNFSKVRKVRMITAASISYSCKDDMHDISFLLFSGLTYLGEKRARLWGCRIEHSVATDGTSSVKLGPAASSFTSGNPQCYLLKHTDGSQRHLQEIYV